MDHQQMQHQKQVEVECAEVPSTMSSPADVGIIGQKLTLPFKSTLLNNESSPTAATDDQALFTALKSAENVPTARKASSGSLIDFGSPVKSSSPMVKAQTHSPSAGYSSPWDLFKTAGGLRFSVNFSPEEKSIAEERFTYVPDVQSLPQEEASKSFDGANFKDNLATVLSDDGEEETSGGRTLWSPYKAEEESKDFLTPKSATAPTLTLPSTKEILYFHIIRQLRFDGHDNLANELIDVVFPNVSFPNLTPNDTLEKIIIIALEDFRKLIAARQLPQSSPVFDAQAFAPRNVNSADSTTAAAAEFVSQQFNQAAPPVEVAATKKYQLAPISPLSTLSTAAGRNVSFPASIQETPRKTTEAYTDHYHHHSFQGVDDGAHCEVHNTSQPIALPNVKRDLRVICKFGSVGGGHGHLNMPHGFCIGFNDEIVIADTNNHRISIFDVSGSFQYAFGDKGTNEGQLFLPRKVALLAPNFSSPNEEERIPCYVICDRGAKRSRMQIFTARGEFLRDIPIPYIDIVSGLCTGEDRKIIVVDSVRSGVSVLTEYGTLLYWFTCAAEMIEPSDVAIFGLHYYICDFKGHCVNVFDQHGVCVKRIAAEGSLKFPNGIDISDDGDVLVGDSHGNHFHVTLFNREGTLLGDFDCPYLKVSRCCGLKISQEGMLVTLAKNNNHVLVLDKIDVFNGNRIVSP